MSKKQQRQNKKARRQQGQAAERSEPHLTEKPTILIVCEGKNTEPSYFRRFRLLTATVKAFGEGYNTVSLVESAKSYAEKSKYDQVWCVFDKDDFSSNDFNGAIQAASNYGFEVAYSNQAFEYWLILHFEDHQGGGMSRKDYHGKINAHLKPFGLAYEGKSSKLISEEFFGIMNGIDLQTKEPRCIRAYKRAKRNYDCLDHSNPASEESSTTVFMLVKELLLHTSSYSNTDFE